MRFVRRQPLRLAVERAPCRAEHDPLDAMCCALFEHVQRTQDVDVRVVGGVPHGLADARMGCGVEHSVRRRRLERRRQFSASDVAFVEHGPGVDVFTAARGERIGHCDAMAALDEPVNQVRADEACSACYEDVHIPPYRSLSLIAVAIPPLELLSGVRRSGKLLKAFRLVPFGSVSNVNTHPNLPDGNRARDARFPPSRERRGPHPNRGPLVFLFVFGHFGPLSHLCRARLFRSAQEWSPPLPWPGLARSGPMYS